MPILNALRAALAWLGRQGTRALAASIFLGLAVPQFAAYLKPYLGEAVFVLLLFSYLRTDPAAFGRYLRAPVLTIVAALWVMVVVPLLFGLAYALSGIREAWPALYTIMILQMAITRTKLFFFFAASGAIAYAIRRVAGQDWIERQKEPIDGLNVIAVFIFAIAAMDGVPRHVMADPLFAVELLALIFVLTCALIGLSVLVFWRAGIDRGLVIGLLAAFRNIGVVMAAVGTSLPDLAWFYFAMVQFPIYLLPAVLRPLARRLSEKR